MSSREGSLIELPKNFYALHPFRY